MTAYPGLQRAHGLPLRYEDLHWGDASRFTLDLRYPSNAPAKRLGLIESISYVTMKDGEPGVYQHDFDAPDNQLPYLLEVTGSGRARTVTTRERNPHALGRVIDIRMQGGTIFIPTLFWIVCERQPYWQGSPVILASAFDCCLAIEHRVWQNKLLPYVVEHGIVG
ncbi:MAG: hypothetical protein EBZ75_13500 [Oxalobacteraceae bacterium]|nr:hypothetical protein [Oxalobacteraceae bacterium]